MLSYHCHLGHLWLKPHNHLSNGRTSRWPRDPTWPPNLSSMRNHGHHCDHVSPLLQSPSPVTFRLAQNNTQAFPETYQALYARAPATPLSHLWPVSPLPTLLRAHGLLALPPSCHPPTPGALHWLCLVLGMPFPRYLRGIFPHVLQVSA